MPSPPHLAARSVMPLLLAEEVALATARGGLDNAFTFAFPILLVPSPRLISGEDLKFSSV